jgi:hypothetical protein
MSLIFMMHFYVKSGAIDKYSKQNLVFMWIHEIWLEDSILIAIFGISSQRNLLSRWEI